GRSPAVAALPAPADRKWHSDAYDEHEEGLYQIPEAHPVPGMMVELGTESPDESAFQLRRDEQIIDAGTLSDKQKHGHTTEKIERHQPSLWGKAGVGRLGSCLPPHLRLSDFRNRLCACHLLTTSYKSSLEGGSSRQAAGVSLGGPWDISLRP